MIDKPFLPGALSTSSWVVESLELPKRLQRVGLRDRHPFLRDLRNLRKVSKTHFQIITFANEELYIILPRKNLTNLKFVNSRSVTVKKHAHTFLKELDTFFEAQIRTPLITKNWPS